MTVQAGPVTDWPLIEAAPRDGSWFVTYTPGVHPDATFDLARFDAEFDDFCKVGCGFQYVERWFPLPPV